MFQDLSKKNLWLWGFLSFDATIIIFLIDLQNTREEICDIQNIIQDHNQRILNLEEQMRELQLDDIEPGSKRIRKGGDRAGWMRIRDEDLSTRDQWCIEGGVFGLYADGVGPLVPNNIRTRRAAVVYSTDPDTVEEHPDPLHPEKYARIVLV